MRNYDEHKKEDQLWEEKKARRAKMKKEMQKRNKKILGFSAIGFTVCFIIFVITFSISFYRGRQMENHCPEGFTMVIENVTIYEGETLYDVAKRVQSEHEGTYLIMNDKVDIHVKEIIKINRKDHKLENPDDIKYGTTIKVPYFKMNK